MGNCLKGSSADDISLLRGADNPVDSSSSDQLGPPPPYRVCTKDIFACRLVIRCSTCVIFNQIKVSRILESTKLLRSIPSNLGMQQHPYFSLFMPESSNNHRLQSNGLNINLNINFKLDLAVSHLLSLYETIGPGLL